MKQTEPSVALITGASSGIGLLTAQALRRRGYRVFGTSRKPMADTAEGIEMIVCDVTDDASVHSAVAEVMRRASRIDLLVNNAGFGIEGAAEESSIAQVHSLFDTNFYGLVRMTNAVLPIMRTQGSGRILNVGSVAGIVPMPFGSYYAATKHAIEGYSESLDHEVRGFGVRVAVIEPAATRTSFESSTTPSDMPNAAYNASRAKYKVAFDKAMAVAVSPDGVAETIVLAAQDSVPRLRYTSGKQARQLSFVRRFLPSSFFDRAVHKQFGLS
jgi:short-subunit dehydrogenase